jgi:hypothetical protein
MVNDDDSDFARPSWFPFEAGYRAMSSDIGANGDIAIKGHSPSRL